MPHCPPPPLESCIARCSKIGQAHPQRRDSIQLHLAGPRRANKKKISGSRREETKNVSATSQSTYKSSSEARESKMPGGSSVRSLSSRSLKATRNEVDQVFRVGSISCPITHHRHQSFDFNSSHYKVALLSVRKLAKLIHKAQALSSCISLGQGERRRRRRRKCEARGGRKQRMPPQPAKVRTIESAKPGSRRCQVAALSGHFD